MLPREPGRIVERNFAIVGATGAVGELMRTVLEERQIHIDSIRFLASAKSAGKRLTFRGRDYEVEPIRPEALTGVNVVLSSTPASVSREFSPIAAKAGAIVIDNSSAWRMDPEVPLVVPEVNSEAMWTCPKRIIANPNCVAIPLTIALKPLHVAAGVKRVIVSTYQSSSGKGAKGLDDLDTQLMSIGRGEAMPSAKAHVGQLAGNVLPHDWKHEVDGYTEEECKVINETRKILDADIPVTVTCVRVPVRIAHALSINVEFEKPLPPAKAIAALQGQSGVIVCDEAPPTPLHVAGRDEVFVGRIRPDKTVPHGLNLWVVADNLRKGAATNAVQIAQALINERA